MKMIAVVSVVVDATLTALASAVGVATPCDGGCGGTDSTAVLKLMLAVAVVLVVVRGLIVKIPVFHIAQLKKCEYFPFL